MKIIGYKTLTLQDGTKEVVPIYYKVGNWMVNRATRHDRASRNYFYAITHIPSMMCNPHRTGMGNKDRLPELILKAAALNLVNLPRNREIWTHEEISLCASIFGRTL